MEEKVTLDDVQPAERFVRAAKRCHVAAPRQPRDVRDTERRQVALEEPYVDTRPPINELAEPGCHQQRELDGRFESEHALEELAVAVDRHVRGHEREAVGIGEGMAVTRLLVETSEYPG